MFRHIWVVLAAVLCAAAPLAAQVVVGEGKIFIRFANLRADDAPIQIRVHVVPNHPKPFTWTGMTIYVGREEGKDQWLPAGTTPARATVEAKLCEPEILVEMSVITAL